MLRYFFLSVILALVALVAITGVRGQKTRNSPLQIFPDMKRQPRFDPQHTNNFFADGRAARTPVAGTVPIGYTLPDRFSQNGASNSPVSANQSFGNSTDYYNTGKIGDMYGDGIPLQPVTEQLLARGKERFGIYCAVCHGAAGYGNGITTNFGLVAVANLQQERLRNMPDGQLFARITDGFNTMAPYGATIAVEDRWAIITYIRALQRSQNAKLTDIPDAERTALLESKK